MYNTRKIGLVVREVVGSNVSIESELRGALGLDGIELQRLYAGTLALSGKDIRVIAGICGFDVSSIQQRNSRYRRANTKFA